MVNLAALSMQVQQQDESAAIIAASVIDTGKLPLHELLGMQEFLQHPLNIDDQAVVEIRGSDMRMDSLFDDMREKTDSAIALESMKAYLKRCHTKGDITKPVIDMATVAMEDMYRRAKLNRNNVRLAYESSGDGTHPELTRSLESIGDSVKAIHNSIKSNIVKITRHVTEIFSIFRSRMESARKRVRELRHELQIKQDDTAAYPAVKAESWCINLCYGSSGFDDGLKRVITDVNSLVDAHALMATNLIRTYVDWMKHHGSSEGDDSIFDTLHTKKEQFLLPGMTEFNRSVFLETPSDDNNYYRSKEYPGGRAFYTQTHPDQCQGLAALANIENTRFKMEVYNPTSYNTTKMKIAAIVALPVATWLSVVNPILGVAVGTIAGSYMASQRQDKVESSVHIGKDMLFRALSKQEITHTLDSVTEGLNKLDKWAVQVLQSPWKSGGLDDAVKELISGEYVSSNYKSYCNAVLRLVSSLSSEVDSYALDVYKSVLLFTEKSLKQYR